VAVQAELGRVSCFSVVSKFRGLINATLLAYRRFISPLKRKKKSFRYCRKSLTDLSSSHHCPLLRIQGFLTGRRIKELDKTIRLFDRHLRQLAVFVEYMK